MQPKSKNLYNESSYVASGTYSVPTDVSPSRAERPSCVRPSRTLRDIVLRQAGALANGEVVGVLAALSLTTLYLPWTHNGSTVRSAFALASAVRAAEPVTPSVDRLLLGAMYLLPIVVVVGCAATLVGRRVVAGCLIAMEGLIVAVASVTVLEGFGPTAAIGSWLGFGIGITTFGGSVAMLANLRGTHAGRL